MKNKTIKPHDAGLLLITISREAELHEEQNSLKNFITQFEAQFPLPEIQRAPRAAEQVQQAGEIECDEMPRAACQGQEGW